ncbi:hypothetical protein A3860_17445 [Niastella vici]|uniref:Uncharacterized protein n=1 Tax=Niastella vici TaxID=1703345 RepID=A0A1V9G483_9BACT|nr:hypothetical protein [Niastella vici]OQP65449.1 hypothetical protein A3860_17445 [Niastella vici]
MSEKVAKPNLFSSAKKVDKKESKKEKQSLDITPEIQEVLLNYKEAKTNFKTWEGKKKIAEGALKPYAAEAYLKECKIQKRHIGSFQLGDVLVMVQDRYGTIDEGVATIVDENFPGIIVRTTEYLFDQEVLAQYINEISESLQKSGIPKADLERLILAKEVISVKKGAIETLASYGDKMADLFNAISPVIAFK